MPARWMLYSYDALGLGHVRRTLSIARSVLARRSDLAALLTTCSPQIDALPVPPGLDYIKLPSARKTASQHYCARTLPIESERLLAMRSDILLDAARWLEPDLLLVDKSPDGLMGELLPALEPLRRRANGGRIVLGWGDILDAPHLVQAEWAERRTLAIIEQYYDEIWVYGDPAIFDVREAYGLPDRLADRVRYLGYLAPAGDPTARDRVHQAMGINGDRLALVTAGGGEDGEALLSCYLESARLGYLPDGLRSMIVTGPFMPQEQKQRVCAAAPEPVRVGRYVPGLEEAIGAADVV